MGVVFGDVDGVGVGAVGEGVGYDTARTHRRRIWSDEQLSG